MPHYCHLQLLRKISCIKQRSWLIKSMVVAVEARKLNLPYLSLSSPQVTSLLYDHNSLSLALMHSDSTFSLFPSFSPFSLSSFPPPRTLIPPPSSSACFVPLNPNPNFPDCTDQTQVVFVTAGPYNGGSRVVMRFYVKKDGNFVKAQVSCSQKGVTYDRRSGVIVDLSHGMKVMLSGSVNYLAMYSASAGKICVFGVKLMGDSQELRLVKCAVIDCCLSVSSVCVSFGFLILGELNGVRVFPLRALVKGRGGSRRRSRSVRGKVENTSCGQCEVNVKSEGRKLKMPNGVIRPIGESHDVDKNSVNVNPLKLMANGHAYTILHGVSSNANYISVKPKSLKLRQDSGEWGMQFFPFNQSIVEGTKSRVLQYKTTKAISIQAVTQQMFLILDSDGDLHVLHLSKSGSTRMRQLTGIIKAQQLAAFPDTSTITHTVWISDGLNSVHMVLLPGKDTTENENDGGAVEEELIQSSVTQAIFTSENIQDMIPLAANTILILGQDSIYAYAIS